MSRFCVLGPVEAWTDERRLPLGGPRQVALLAFLLLNANRAVSADAIIDAVWGADRAGSAKRLRMAVLRLRRALEPLDREDDPRLRTVGGGYLLSVRPGELDADEFGERVRAGRRALDEGNPSCASELLAQALELWRGPPLADVAFEDFAQGEIRRLEELRLGALEARIDADIQQACHEELIGELEALLAEHPTREGLARQLMTVLYRTGRQAEALEVYQRTRVRLAAELGLEPGPALKTLQAQILDQAPALQPAGDSGPGPMRHVWLRRVPAPATATIGRERELNEVIALLRVPAVRLVTLTGPGGVGKTRLALVVAHALKHSFEQGVVWVELAGISRPDDVGSAIVRALEVQPAPGESTTDTLLRYLADKKLLLVVDNFEHVLDSVGLIGVLVTNCPELTVLATSREALGIAAEHRYEVAPMPLPPLPSEADVAEVEATAGTALFLAAARRHQHAFAVDSACAPLVARICGRLDGLPLALELAAARLSVLTLSELDARLTDAVTGIGSAPRDAPERQRTLRATIAWSYRLLDEEEQRAFLRFAVFAGGATVSAAQQVCGASLETLEALQAKSLLRLREQPDGSGRLMMLETLRQFALDEGADREDIGKIRRRHCAWYLRLVDECGARLDTPDEPEAVDALDRDIDNIRSALGWALADDPGQAVKLAGLLGDYWRVHNDPGGLPWIEAATAVAGDRVPPTDRARLRLVHSFQLSPMRQQWQAAIGAATEALELYRESGDDAGTATAYRALALLRVHVGQYSEARADATAACTHASAAGDTALYARSLSTLAILLPSSERPAVVDRAARLLSEAGDHREVAALYSNIGYSALVEEGPEQALDLFNNALKAAEKLRPSASTKMLVLSNIGLAQLRLGNLKDARRTFLDALKLCTTEAFRWGGHESLAGLAAVRVVEGDPEQGAQLYGAAQAAGYPPTDPYDEEMLELLERDYFDAARTRLGPARWTELTRAGAELTFDQAVRFALTAAAPLEHGSDAAEHRATVTADR